MSEVAWDDPIIEALRARTHKLATDIAALQLWRETIKGDSARLAAVEIALEALTRKQEIDDAVNKQLAQHRAATLTRVQKGFALALLLLQILTAIVAIRGGR